MRTLCSVCLGAFMIGCVNGWIAPALSRLLSGKEGFIVTKDEASWLALYPEFGHFLAPIPAGIIADYTGRKLLFVFCSILAVTGWSIMAYSNELTYLFIGRIILGFNFGAQATIMMIYTAEISDKRWRGTFSSMIIVFFHLGILFQFVIGSYLSFNMTAMLTAILGGIHLLLTVFIVESPYYLLTQAEETAAKAKLSWLRASEHVNDEFDQILKRVVAKTDVTTLIRNLKSNCKGLLLCFMLNFLVELTGRTVVLTYATQNFQSQSIIPANYLTILLGVFNVLSHVVPVLLSDRVGRRILILIGGASAGITHLSTGFLYFFHSSLQIEIPYFSWLLLSTMTAYLCCCSVTVTNTLTLRGELIAENGRGLASGLASMGFAVAALIGIKLFQVSSDHIGKHGAFWLFSGFCFTFVASAWVFLPETKNKTFEEIQNSLETVGGNQSRSELPRGLEKLNRGSSMKCAST